MQRINNIKRAAAEIYWQIQEEITNSTLMEYIHTDTDCIIAQVQRMCEPLFVQGEAVSLNESHIF